MIAMSVWVADVTLLIYGKYFLLVMELSLIIRSQVSHG